MKISFINSCYTVELRTPRHWRSSGADNGIFGGGLAEREVLPGSLCLGMTNEWPPDVVASCQLLLGIYCYSGRIKETDHLFCCHLFRSAEKFLWNLARTFLVIYSFISFLWTTSFMLSRTVYFLCFRWWYNFIIWRVFQRLPPHAHLLVAVCTDRLN